MIYCPGKWSAGVRNTLVGTVNGNSGASVLRPATSCSCWMSTVKNGNRVPAPVVGRRRLSSSLVTMRGTDKGILCGFLGAKTKSATHNSILSVGIGDEYDGIFRKTGSSLSCGAVKLLQ